MGDGEFAAADVDVDHCAVMDIAAQQGTADAGLDFAGDEALQGTGAVDRVVALPSNEATGFGGDFEGYLAVHEPGPQVIWAGEDP